jgi:hypothetical protein
MEYKKYGGGEDVEVSVLVAYSTATITTGVSQVVMKI